MEHSLLAALSFVVTFTPGIHLLQDIVDIIVQYVCIYDVGKHS